MKLKSLIIIVIAFTALASLYSFVIPLGEGPDEPGHASYVFFLARTGRLPDQRANEVPGEGHQPPLAYLLAAPLVAWLPADQRGFDLPGNARFTWAAPSPNAQAAREANAVAHGSREYWPWQGVVLAWHLARLVSVALGAATVGLTYLTARALVDERPKTEDEGQAAFAFRPSSFVPLLAAAIVAFNPQFLFVSALITNDALLTALSAVLLWLVVRGERREAIGARGAPALWAAVVGVVLGLALITKQSAIVLVPVAFLAIFEQSYGAEPKQHWRHVILSPRHLVRLLAFVAAVLAICGWWYLRNRQLYGDLFGLAMFQGEFSTGAFDARSPAAWFGALAQLHASFWARFGWMNVPAPGWVIMFFAGVELAAVIGWVRYVDERRKTKDERARFGLSSFVIRLARLWPILALPLLAFAWVFSFALTAGLVAWQGRLLFPALPAIAIVLATGLSQWMIGNRHLETLAQPIVYRLLPLTLVALAAWLPFGVIRPAYPFHTLPGQVAQQRIGTPVYGRLGLVGDPGAELLGWQLSGAPQAGSAPTLRLIWHALGRQNRNWTVFVHLVDANDQIVAQADAEPQAGAFPMKQWVAGDWVEDEHTLALPASLPPGTYSLRVGLYYPRTGRRAAVFDQKGKLVGDSVELGSLRIE